jgi:predicted metalloprotease
MNIDQALAEIIAYSVAHGVDSLAGIESMVKHYKTLSAEQRLAVTVFMERTKEEV